MKYGFVIDAVDVRTIGELAEETEAAGWDGAFISDALSMGSPWFDTSVALSVMAMRTKRIRIGTMITPVSRRRPWKLAREAVSLDQLSGGRLTLGVGLGAAEHDGGFSKVGEETDLKVRAQLLDEGLEIMAGLWSGKPFSFSGEHYEVEKMTMLPKPTQSPRIPIWAVGVWPRQKSLQRTIRWDGIIPQKYKTMDRMTPAEIQALKQFIDDHRKQTTPFDIIAGGQTPGGNHKQAAKLVRPFAEAGGTWWIENVWGSLDKMRKRIKQGPPRLE